MTLTNRLHQLARFHREHGLRYVHPKFGEQTMATMVAEIEEAAERIAELEAALRPFGEAYRYMQQMGPFVRREMEAATTVTEKFAVADLHRASELTKTER